MRYCFCEDLEECKQIDKQFEFKDFKRRYTVALVAYDYKGHKRKGSITHYNNYQYKLNFCPECGRPLGK